jgi:steroid delta-isomerase-like uncharacterized protein
VARIEVQLQKVKTILEGVKRNGSESNGKEWDMSHDPKAVAGRFYEIMDNWESAALDEICSPDLRGHAGAGADLDQLKDSIGSFVQAFPDLRAEVQHLVREDDTVSTWVSYQGTHKGEFAGVPGSGRSVKFAAWDLFRIEDGEIAEITQYCDVFTILNQIGALPTTAPA